MKYEQLLCFPVQRRIECIHSKLNPRYFHVEIFHISIYQITEISIHEGIKWTLNNTDTLYMIATLLIVTTP